MPLPAGDELWVLEGLQERLGDDAGAGAVTYAGTVALPTGERYVWQMGARVEPLLAADADDVVPALAALGHRVRSSVLRRRAGPAPDRRELAGPEALFTGRRCTAHHLPPAAAGSDRAA